MAVIDIGPGATDRSSNYTYGRTVISWNNPANDSGYLDSFEVWAVSNISDFVIGTLSRVESTFTSRDSETIGSVVSGSKQTYTGKNCDVTTGDYLGVYYSAGTIEYYGSGGSGLTYATGNKFGAGEFTGTFQSGDIISIYATGATVAAGNPYYYYLNQ